MATAETRGTVARSLDLLRCFATARADWSVSELAQSLALAPSTVHRLLGIFRSLGFVDVHPATRRYRPGAELYRVAAILAANMPVIGLARPLLEEIVAASSEMTLLGLYNPERLTMSFAAKVEPPSPMRYAIALNEPHPLLWGSTGRALLAFVDDATRARVLERDDPSPVTGARVDRDALQRELSDIRTHAYALSRGQRTASAVGIAVPFFWAGDAVCGTISLTIPDHRFAAARTPEYVALLHGAADRLTAALGSDRRLARNAS
ncbi:MAG: IclR family transcriptional regulator [Vulcanimicrobiaceae bacterium]